MKSQTKNSIKSVDDGRVILLSIGVGIFFLIAGGMFLGSVGMGANSKTVFQEIEGSVVFATAILLSAIAGVIASILTAACLVIREIRIQNALTRQLLRAYGNVPEA